MLQVTLGLLLVLVMIGGLAWAVARLSRFRPTSTALVRVVTAVSVGPRERVAVVDVGGQWLVLGVAPGSVNLLAKTAPLLAGGTDPVGLPGPASASALPSLPSFTSWLQRALNRKQDS